MSSHNYQHYPSAWWRSRMIPSWTERFHLFFLSTGNLIGRWRTPHSWMMGDRIQHTWWWALILIYITYFTVMVAPIRLIDQVGGYLSVNSFSRQHPRSQARWWKFTLIPSRIIGTTQYIIITYANASSSWGLKIAIGLRWISSKKYVPWVPKSVNFGVIPVFSAASTYRKTSKNF